MNTPNENAAAVAQLVAAVKRHPLCLRFSDVSGKYLVIYPAGEFPVDGVQASQGGGKAVALARMLEVMERHWVESYPDPRANPPRTLAQLLA